MPRDGSGIYSTLAGTFGIPDTVVASSPYNANVSDVANDLNVPRPIVAGGTGASNAVQARTNLGAESANIQVTDYGMHTFSSGSFWSGNSASDSPEPGASFSGSAIVFDSNNIVLRVYRLGDGRPYQRIRTGAGWGPWVLLSMGTAAEIDGKVDIAGDTMTGTLTMSGSATPQIVFSPTTGATKTVQIYQQGNVMNIADASVAVRWSMDIATGNVSNAGNLYVGGNATIASGAISLPATAANINHSGTSGYLLIDSAQSDIYIRPAATAQLLLSDQGNPTVVGGPLDVNSSVASTSSTTGALTVTGGVGIGGALNVAGNGLFQGTLTTWSTFAAWSLAATGGLASTDPTTGALVVTGGAGIS